MTERSGEHIPQRENTADISSIVRITFSDDLLKLATETPSTNNSEFIRTIDPKIPPDHKGYESMAPDRLRLSKALCGCAVGDTMLHENLDGEVTFVKVLEVK